MGEPVRPRILATAPMPPPPPPPRGRFFGPDVSLLGSGPHDIIMQIAQNTGINWLSITFEPYGLEGGGPSTGPFLDPLLPPQPPSPLPTPILPPALRVPHDETRAWEDIERVLDTLSDRRPSVKF